MSRTPWGSRVLWATGLVTAAAIAAGVWVIDSPNQQRLKRLDGARLSELQALDSAARSYWREHDALPADIHALLEQPGVALSSSDPAGGPDFSYRPLDATLNYAHTLTPAAPMVRAAPRSTNGRIRPGDTASAARWPATMTPEP